MSCVSLPAFSCSRLLSWCELGAEPVEAGLPQAAVLSIPFVQLAEWLRAQRVEALLPLRPHAHDPCLVKDAKVPRDARLLNVHGFHERVHGALACPERLHDPTARRIGEDLEYDRLHAGCIHVCVYTLFCISRAIARFFTAADGEFRFGNGRSPGAQATYRRPSSRGRQVIPWSGLSGVRRRRW